LRVNRNAAWMVTLSDLAVPRSVEMCKATSALARDGDGPQNHPQRTTVTCPRLLTSLVGSQGSRCFMV
jgi:hypothetical protein